MAPDDASDSCLRRSACPALNASMDDLSLA